MESDADAEDIRDDLSCRAGRLPDERLWTRWVLYVNLFAKIKENEISTYGSDKKNEQNHICSSK